MLRPNVQPTFGIDRYVCPIDSLSGFWPNRTAVNLKKRASVKSFPRE
jgi:hypothetical protein